MPAAPVKPITPFFRNFGPVSSVVTVPLTLMRKIGPWQRIVIVL